RGPEPVGGARTLAIEQVAAARLVVPEPAVELEALAAVLADEQPAGDGADVDAARRAKADHPQLEQRGVLDHHRAGRRAVLVGHRRDQVAGALRVLDLRGVTPAVPAVVGARQLGAPVAVAERGPQRAGLWLAGDEVDALARVTGQPRLPAAALLVDDECALASTDQDRIGH